MREFIEQTFRDGLNRSKSGTATFENGVKVDGNLFLPVLSTIFPAKNNSGEEPSCWIILRDITLQKQFEPERIKYLMKLQHSNEELQHFSYIASHDMQEPLRSIIGHIQLLAKKSAGKLDEQCLRSLNFAVEGAKRMKDFIHGLLDYVGTGNEQPKKIEISLNKLIDEVRRDLELTIKEHDAQNRNF